MTADGDRRPAVALPDSTRSGHQASPRWSSPSPCRERRPFRRRGRYITGKTPVRRSLKSRGRLPAGLKRGSAPAEKWRVNGPNPSFVQQADKKKPKMGKEKDG